MYDENSRFGIFRANKLFVFLSYYYLLFYLTITIGFHMFSVVERVVIDW